MTSHKFLLPAFTAIAFALAANAQETKLVMVRGDRVNLRAAPESEAEVVGQVSTPETLVMQGSLDDPWVKVTPPDKIDLWIFSNLVGPDGKVNVNKALVRAGAGVNYRTVGELEFGASVHVRGKVGDWLKIAPFPTAAVWVTNAYVQLAPADMVKQNPPPAAPAPTPEAAAAPQPVPPMPEPVAEPVPEPATIAHDTTAPLAPPPQLQPMPPEPIADTTPQSVRTLDDAPVGPAKVPGNKLRADVAQAGSGSYAGMLALSPAGVHPTPYRIVLFDRDNKPRTVCYVLGNRKQLDALKEEYYTIEGAVYWFRGTELPTIFAQNILRHRR